MWLKYLDIRSEAEHGGAGAFECLEGEGQGYPACGIGRIGLLEQGMNAFAEDLGKDGNELRCYTHGYRILGPARSELAAPLSPIGRQVEAFRTLTGFFRYCCCLYPRNSQDSHLTFHRSHQVPDTSFGDQAQWIDHALDNFSIGFAVCQKQLAVMPDRLLKRM